MENNILTRLLLILPLGNAVVLNSVWIQFKFCRKSHTCIFHMYQTHLKFKICVPWLAPLNVSLGMSIVTDPIESNSVSQVRWHTNSKGVDFSKTVFSVVHCASAFNQCVSIQPYKLGVCFFNYTIQKYSFTCSFACLMAACPTIGQCNKYKYMHTRKNFNCHDLHFVYEYKFT